MDTIAKYGTWWVRLSWYEQRGDELAAAEAVIEDLTARNAELLAVCHRVVDAWGELDLHYCKEAARAALAKELEVE